jgi:hypothetical protein
MRLSKLLSLALLLALGACGGGNPGTPTNPSAPSRSSHNAGRDCLQCHGFTLAGTVYRGDGSIYPGAVVRLTSQPAGSGDVLATLTTDASGNFYTDEPVSWGGGLYADVQGSGARQPMTQPLTGGACNSCHAGQDRIRVD